MRARRLQAGARHLTTAVVHCSVAKSGTSAPAEVHRDGTIASGSGLGPRTRLAGGWRPMPPPFPDVLAHPGKRAGGRFTKARSVAATRARERATHGRGTVEAPR